MTLMSNWAVEDRVACIMYEGLGATCLSLGPSRVSAAHASHQVSQTTQVVGWGN